MSEACANPSTMTLDGLPTEIIRRIAAFLPCQSALFLMRTSHQFHNIIKDRLIFKGMLNRQTLSTLKALPPSSPDSPADDFTISLWARLAAADERAWQLIDEHPSKLDANKPRYDIDSPPLLDDKRNMELITFLPQLMAAHHPIISSLYSTGLVAPFSTELKRALPTNVDFFYVFDFCLTALILQRGIPQIHSQNNIDDIDIEIFKLITLLDQFTVLERGYEEARFSAMFMCSLVEFLRSDHANSASLPVLPPSTRDIPFTTFMDLPAWFSPNATHDFRFCHLRGMTAPSFLLDGKWASYYSLSTDFAASMVFQPPVIDIQFTRVEDHLDALPRLPDGGGGSGGARMTATGNDSFGIFEAEGRVNAYGEMKMIETNWRGQQWLWDLKMCPFGLFGTWGTMHQVNGFLWLFKEEWGFKPGKKEAVEVSA